MLCILYIGTVPVNKELLTGTVPVNNFIQLIIDQKFRQAGAVLGQAQLKLGLDCTSINLH